MDIDFTHADAITVGMRKRVHETIQTSGQSLCGVVFSTADVLYLLDAYDRLRDVVAWCDDCGEALKRCRCGHPWEAHDNMGDCHHLDGRTKTGYCERCR